MFQITILVLLCLTVGGLALNLNAFSAKSTTAIKKELLELSNKVQRGLIETEQERAKILQLFEQLEKKNPTKEPLKSPKINAIWSLDYTTSDSILGRGGAKRVGKILQKIDAVNLKGENSEVRNYFGLNVPVSVTADFSPMSKSKVSNTLFLACQRRRITLENTYEEHYFCSVVNLSVLTFLGCCAIQEISYWTYPLRCAKFIQRRIRYNLFG